jgi:hypothetical protein
MASRTKVIENEGKNERDKKLKNGANVDAKWQSWLIRTKTIIGNIITSNLLHWASFWKLHKQMDDTKGISNYLHIFGHHF